MKERVTRFYSTFQGRFNFQGILRNIQILFQPVFTMARALCFLESMDLPLVVFHKPVSCWRIFYDYIPPQVLSD